MRFARRIFESSCAAACKIAIIASAAGSLRGESARGRVSWPHLHTLVFRRVFMKPRNDFGSLARGPKNQSPRLHAKTQSNHVWQKRTADRRQRPRQHRNSSAWQVHAATACQRFFVKLRAWTHVRADVRNCDPDAISAVVRMLHPNGVVVVTCILWVNRRKRYVGDIFATHEHFSFGTSTP